MQRQLVYELFTILLHDQVFMLVRNAVHQLLWRTITSALSLVIRRSYVLLVAFGHCHEISRLPVCLVVLYEAAMVCSEWQADTMSVYSLFDLVLVLICSHKLELRDSELHLVSSDQERFLGYPWSPSASCSLLMNI